jgi:transposase
MHSQAMPPGRERHNRIVKLYREGMTIHEISLRFGLSYWTIRNELLAEANGGNLPKDPKKGLDWRTVAITAQ